MANNPYVNKVIKADGTVLIDISDATATESTVASGVTFYKANGQKATGTLEVTTLYRQYWTSNNSMSVTLAANGKTYLLWCASPDGSDAGAIADETYGAMIIVSNGEYIVQHKGTEITVDETSGTLTVSSNTNIAMAIVEV